MNNYMYDHIFMNIFYDISAEADHYPLDYLHSLKSHLHQCLRTSIPFHITVSNLLLFAQHQKHFHQCFRTSIPFYITVSNLHSEDEIGSHNFSFYIEENKEKKI